jgi:hypothetical protein
MLRSSGRGEVAAGGRCLRSRFDHLKAGGGGIARGNSRRQLRWVGGASGQRHGEKEGGSGRQRTHSVLRIST